MFFLIIWSFYCTQGNLQSFLKEWGCLFSGICGIACKEQLRSFCTWWSQKNHSQKRICTYLTKDKPPINLFRMYRNKTSHEPIIILKKFQLIKSNISNQINNQKSFEPIFLAISDSKVPPTLEKKIVEVSYSLHRWNGFSVKTPYSNCISHIQQLVSMISIDLLYDFFVPICFQRWFLHLSSNLFL